MEFNKDKLVKSPLNYIGNKFKLLPQLLPLFPTKINTLYDVFGGGGSIALNTNAEHVYYNDIVNYICDMFKALQNENVCQALYKIYNIINTYDLSITNEDGFNKLRKDYNAGNKSWDMFYVLVCYSFNYQFRFNSNHDYNSSFGKNRSCYSQTTEAKFIKFMERLHQLDIVFDCKDFRDVDFSVADSDDLVYLDPPYSITVGNYNDGKRGFEGWSKKDDKDLLNLCDRLNQQGTRFALSNVLESKGKSNELLKEWSKKYNINYINSDYSNCNYQTKDKNKGTTVEVLITNY